MGKGNQAMKRLAVLLLALVMAASLSVAAFAADNTVSYDANNEEGQTSGLSVTYNVEPTFTVTIPASVALGNDVTVSTEDVIVEYGKAVNGIKARPIAHRSGKPRKPIKCSNIKKFRILGNHRKAIASLFHECHLKAQRKCRALDLTGKIGRC